jgi:NAD(P)-dependent dehydrogenase (short-subunit alcohol dehydrogenase family)
MVQDGVSTGELDRFARDLIRKRGAEPAFLGYMNYPASLCVSINDEVIHGIPGKRRLCEGDIVSLDLGVNLDGYYSDAAVTLAVGAVSPERSRLIEVTRACLPMLRAARGRIVNVSSISGLVALPGVSVYAGSKHAVEAITDALRVELAGFGIHVSSVEPGSVRTAIWEKGAARDQARAKEPGTAETRKLYAPLVKLLEKLNSRPGVLPPEKVADAIADALESEKPRNRYLCGNDAKSLSLLGKLPDGIRDRLIGSKIR